MSYSQFEVWSSDEDLSSIVSSTYYYTKEKYRSICEEILDKIWEEEFIKFKNKYKNPVDFAEDYLGIELQWCQKVLLRMGYKKNNLIYNTGRRY